MLKLFNIKLIVFVDIVDNFLSCGSGDIIEFLKYMLKLNMLGILFGGFYDFEFIK